MTDRRAAARKAAETRRWKQRRLFTVRLRQAERELIRREREAERRREAARRAPGQIVRATTRGGGAEVGVTFFVLGLLILLGLPQMLPALYRTLAEAEEGPRSDKERAQEIEDGLRGLQNFVTRSGKLIGQLFVVALGITALGAFDEDAAKALAALMLFLLIVRDWATINEELRAMAVPREATPRKPVARKS